MHLGGLLSKAFKDSRVWFVDVISELNAIEYLIRRIS